MITVDNPLNWKLHSSHRKFFDNSIEHNTCLIHLQIGTPGYVHFL